jgi:hypothetical protein
VIQTVTAQLYYRLFIAGEPLTEAIADRAAAARGPAGAAGGRFGPHRLLSYIQILRYIQIRGTLRGVCGGRER